MNIYLLPVIALAVFSMKALSTNMPEEFLHIPIPLISGKDTSLAEYKGKKPVYLKFWATWCQPCRKEMPHFEKVQKKYGETIEVIGINLGVNDSIKAIEDTINEFGLTMPIAIDKQGDLAQAFRIKGTPWGLLFDRDINLIHYQHNADESLDDKIDLVSRVEPVDLMSTDLLAEKEPDLNLNLDDGKLHALFFSATWCDWYLKESRPQYSKHCVVAQNNLNTISGEYSNIVWHGIVSRLWTGDRALQEYIARYSVSYPIEIDNSNSWFHQYSIRDVPTLILVKNGKTVLKVTNFNDKEQLTELIDTVIN